MHGTYGMLLKTLVWIDVIGSFFTYHLYNNKLTEAMRILIEGKKRIKKTWSDVKWRGVYSEVKKGLRCQKEKAREEERYRVGCRIVSRNI